MQNKLSGASEDNVLCLLVFSERYCSRIALSVEADLFSTRAYQTIAAAALDYLDKFKKPPRTHIRDLLENDIKGANDSARFMRQIIDAMEELDKEIQGEYVLETLDKFIETRRLMMAVLKASDLLNDGQLDEAREALHATTKQRDVDQGAWLHDAPNWFTFLDKSDDELFSSGIRALDERGITPARKELMFLIASTGLGKSWWLTECGRANVIEHHKNVCHISLENSLDIVKQRYTQTFLSLTREEEESVSVPIMKRDELGRFMSLSFDRYTAESLASLGKTKLTKKMKPYYGRGKLYTHWFPEGTLTVSGLHQFLDNLEKQDNFVPDLLIIDYAEKMRTDADNLRISTGRLFSDLRGLAGTRNLALVTASQGNRQSAGAKLVRSTNAAEDWSKIGTGDVVLTYSQTDEEKEQGLARILVAKARNRKDMWIALISQSYATGQFAIDSVFFNKVAQTELDRVMGFEE
jgi:replicative DNA helicase